MSKEIVKNYGKSIRSKLLNISKSEDIYYQTVLTRYFQERLIYRISQTTYRQNFYLKGGALMYAHEKFAARPTLDIDFLGNNISNNGERIVAAFREICSVPCEEDSRMKDYYDLYQILNNQELDSAVLQEAIVRTFENRHTKYEPDTMFFRSDFGTNPIMETRWKAFMKKITAKQSIRFSEVVECLQEQLLPYWNNLNH